MIFTGNTRRGLMGDTHHHRNIWNDSHKAWAHGAYASPVEQLERWKQGVGFTKAHTTNCKRGEMYQTSKGFRRWLFCQADKGILRSFDARQYLPGRLTGI